VNTSRHAQDLHEVTQHYGRLASCYDTRWRGYTEGTLRYALELLQLTGAEQVLDVGCGTGELARVACERWPSLALIGVDVTAAMVAVARRKLCGMSGASFALARSETLPFGEARFDAAVCCNMLHHVPDPAKMIQECGRVLRPQGVMVLVDWCRDFWHCGLMHGWLRLVDQTYVRMYRLRELQALVEAQGLSVDTGGRFLVPPCYGMMGLRAIKLVRASA